MWQYQLPYIYFKTMCHSPNSSERSLCLNLVFVKYTCNLCIGDFYVYSSAHPIHPYGKFRQYPGIWSFSGKWNRLKIFYETDYMLISSPVDHKFHLTHKESRGDQKDKMTTSCLHSLSNARSKPHGCQIQMLQGTK